MTKSYIAGSTNSLLHQQKDRYSDVLINTDDATVAIFSPSLRSALALSHADRRWIDFIVQSVHETWDPDNPTRPSTHGYTGSDAFILAQFEEYLLALLSSAKYSHHLSTRDTPTNKTPDSGPPDPITDFSPAFIESWRETDNARIFFKTTAADLFDVVEPKHPCAGGLTIEDVQRRVAQQVKDLQLEERFAPARTAINERLEAGQKRMSGVLVGLRNEYETRRKQFEERREKPAEPTAAPADDDDATQSNRGAELAQGAQANIQAAGARASAYFSSWGTWAAEKKKNYYAGKTTAAPSMTLVEAGNVGGATGAKVMNVWRASGDMSSNEGSKKENEKTKPEEGPRNFERGYDTVED